MAELWNSDGGVLLIGVRDDPREVTCLEDDYRLVRPKNADGFCSWLGQMLRHRINAVVAASVRIRIEEVAGDEIARIDVPGGPRSSVDR